MKLSIQQALIGEVTDRIVAVTCGITGHHIRVRAYVRGKVNEDDVERVQTIGAQVIADFPDGYTIEEACMTAGSGDPEMLDFWAFLRASREN